MALGKLKMLHWGAAFLQIEHSNPNLIIGSALLISCS